MKESIVIIVLLVIMYFGYNPFLDSKVNDFLRNGSFCTETICSRDSSVFFATEQSKNYSVEIIFHKSIAFKQEQHFDFKITDKEGNRTWIYKNNILIDNHISSKTYNELFLFFKNKYNLK